MDDYGAIEGTQKRKVRRVRMQKAVECPIQGNIELMTEREVPRPREDALLRELVSGKSVRKAMVSAGFNAGSNSIRNRLKPGKDLRIRLEMAMNKAGLTLPRTLKRLSDKLDAMKVIQIDKEATTVDDNDAQLRAVDITLKLHQASGAIPVGEVVANGSPITVNVMNLNIKE